MLHHTVEFSSPFVNESFGAFCLCNFIVALLLLLNFGRGAAMRCYGESKETDFNDDEEPEKHEKPETEAMDRNEKNQVNNTNIKKDDNGEEDKEEDDEELRRRAEEFIQRMVQVWKVEKQIQRSQLMIN